MNILLMILQLLPSIIAAVKSIEDLAPIPNAGKQKLDLVLDSLKQGGAAVDQMIPMVTNIIGKVVAFANAVGAFKSPPK